MRGLGSSNPLCSSGESFKNRLPPDNRLRAARPKHNGVANQYFCIEEHREHKPRAKRALHEMMYAERRADCEAASKLEASYFRRLAMGSGSLTNPRRQ
jgi:hypothetical protein